MTDPLLIQKQIKDNNEDLLNFVRDLKLWEEEMKRKDRQLTKDPTCEEVLPPVRRPKLAKKNEIKESESEKKRIRSYDYKAWDNFDVDKACADVDEKSDTDDDDTNEDQEKFIKEKALYEKELGNKHVKAGKWDEAIEAYTRAIDAFSRDPVFFANRALCYLKRNKYEAVEADCTESLKLDCTYVKALLRRAAAREKLDRGEDARADLRRVLQLEPHNQQALKDLERLERMPRSNNAKVASTCDTAKQDLNVSRSQSKSNEERVKSESDNSTCKKIATKESEPGWKLCSKTIEPISKPPHLRSKKSLKRVTIFDVGRDIPEHNCPRQARATPSVESRVTASPVVGSPSARGVHTVTAPVSCVPPPPVNSVQFHIAWKAIKCDRKMCHQFLKKIPGEKLPEIFKESLESSVFSNIVEVLAEEFMPAEEPVLAYLRGLAGVRRFSAIALFMSSSDKSNIQKLFDYCLKKGEGSREEIGNLCTLYELK